MDANTISKLQKLREYYYDDDYSLKWIDDVEKNIRKLVVQEDLSTNKAVVAIIDDAMARINTINQFLQMDENLTTEDRSKLYRERNVHQFYLDRFVGRDIEKRFETTGKVLDQELERIGVRAEDVK